METKYKNLPFSKLVKDDKYLSGLRRDYASLPAPERRKAADWEYHSQIANEVFNDAIATIGKEGFEKSNWPSGFVALAIDPLYGPAILTVASIEYQLGRIEEAMKLLNQLAKLPEDEAEEVLKRSISLAPSDYEIPHNNLIELIERKNR